MTGIYTIEDFLAIEDNNNYQLMNDIDLNGVDIIATNRKIENIKIDGKNHTISNFNIIGENGNHNCFFDNGMNIEIINITFSNIIINPNGNNKAGCILFYSAYRITVKNIEINNIVNYSNRGSSLFITVSHFNFEYIKNELIIGDTNSSLTGFGGIFYQGLYPNKLTNISSSIIINKRINFLSNYIFGIGEILIFNEDLIIERLEGNITITKELYDKNLRYRLNIIAVLGIKNNYGNFNIILNFIKGTININSINSYYTSLTTFNGLISYEGTVPLMINNSYSFGSIVIGNCNINVFANSTQNLIINNCYSFFNIDTDTSIITGLCNHSCTINNSATIIDVNTNVPEDVYFITNDISILNNVLYKNNNNIIETLPQGSKVLNIDFDTLFFDFSVGKWIRNGEQPYFIIKTNNTEIVTEVFIGFDLELYYNNKILKNEDIIGLYICHNGELKEVINKYIYIE